ncbi:hypothetical protein [Nonomuraea ceibae]|uniref:hypothetical protein n=1 Tax=Nonomuraea ceibae TaxID=1935170 RepID=UPI001C5FE5A7|nr:hypothetical protein [Nonomuraea ceibae]
MVNSSAKCPWPPKVMEALHRIDELVGCPIWLDHVAGADDHLIVVPIEGIGTLTVGDRDGPLTYDLDDRRGFSVALQDNDEHFVGVVYSSPTRDVDALIAWLSTYLHQLTTPGHAEPEDSGHGHTK